MGTEQLTPGENPENRPSLVNTPGQLRNDFTRRRPVPESTDQPTDTESIASIRRQLEAIPQDPAQNSLIFSSERFATVASLPSEARQNHFTNNITALRSLAGDVRMVPRNPVTRAGEIILDIIRFPVNPIDNVRRLKESTKRVIRKLHFTKNLSMLREMPEDSSVSLNTDPRTAEHQIATSLSQMRRDALPYDGRNPFIRWIVNTYAKSNINMPAAKALSWFAAGNIPFIGFALSAGKLYLPNVIAPLYDRKFIRAGKTLLLTAIDFGANIGLSVKAGLMIHDGWELFASQGFLGGLVGVPLFLLNNWEILAPYPFLLAYNPLFIQGRLDQNDYRKYARHFEDMARLVWKSSPTEQEQVMHGVEGMLADYGKSHPGNTLQENMHSLTTLMEGEYTALLERLADETSAISALQAQLAQMPEENHRFEREIAELSLRNKAHKARLLFIENLYLLMQQTQESQPYKTN